MSRPGAEVGGPQRPAVETRRVTSSARLGDDSSYLVTGLTGGGAGREGREIGLVLTPHIVRRLEAGREGVVLAVRRYRAHGGINKSRSSGILL